MSYKSGAIESTLVVISLSLLERSDSWVLLCPLDATTIMLEILSCSLLGWIFPAREGEKALGVLVKVGEFDFPINAFGCCGMSLLWQIKTIKKSIPSAKDR